MFKIALLIGLYSYSIFFLGLLGILGMFEIGIVTIFFLLGELWVLGKVLKQNLIKWFAKLAKIEKFFFFLLILVGVVNLIGALGPELAFDSLWYHLTLPKIYLTESKIFYIPGSLFYYSAMPKLVDMLYIPSILFGGATLAKVVHFLFGVGCLYVLYKLARKFVNTKLALLSCVIFYSNLVVSWLSITSYIDLARAFFEILAVYFFVEYIQVKKEKFLNQSAIMLGLALATKLLSAFSLLVFIPLIFFVNRSVMKTVKYIFLTLLIPLPWFIFSYLSTGNPIYPFMTSMYKSSPPISIVNLTGFIHSPDPVSPIYLIFLPLIFVVFNKFEKSVKFLIFYSIGNFILWFIAQTEGTGRYLVSYLPIFAVICVCALDKTRNKFVKRFLITIVIFIAVVTILYRGIANMKYIPVVFGVETRQEFLTNNLNFSYGDFYDTDEYFAKNLTGKDRVLVYNIHNLYYADFPFVESTYVMPEDKFNYVLVRGEIPDEFKKWKRVYMNKQTNVLLLKQ